MARKFRGFGHPYGDCLAVLRILRHARLTREELTSEQLARRFEELTGRHITTAAVTARARDLRKEKYGGYRVLCERRGDLHVYFLLTPPGASGGAAAGASA